MSDNSASSRGVAEVDENGTLNVVDLYSGVGGLSLALPGQVSPFAVPSTSIL